MNEQQAARYAILITAMASFITPFLGSSMNVALPVIAGEFNLDAVTLSWIAGSFLVAAAAFLVPFGRLADIHGRKRIFLYGILLYTVASACATFSPTISFLFAGRILQGIGSAMIFTTSVAILTSVVPPGERGRALGVNVAAVYLGLSVGPPAGGLLTHSLGWRSLFAVHILLGSLLLVLTFSKLHGDWAEARGERFDLFDSILYVFALLALMVGLALLPHLRGMLLIPAGAVTLIFFAYRQLRRPHPLLEIRLFKNAAFTFSNLAAFINYSATFAVSFLLSLYLQYVKGLDARSTGLILSAQPIVMAAFSPASGRLSDRVEPRILASAGMLLNAVGLGLLLFLNETTTITSIVEILALLGLGFALFSSPNTNAVMSSVERPFYGAASGTLATMRLTGQMFSMGIATMLFSILFAGKPIGAESTGAFLDALRWAFGLFAVLSAGGIFASMARGTLR